MIWEKLLPEPNSRVAITWWSCVRRHFPTEILRVSRQISAEASYAYRQTANLFVRVLGCYGGIFEMLPIFGITANTNWAFVNSRITLMINFPSYAGRCFASLMGLVDRRCPYCVNNAHGFIFDIHIREMSRLARLIRFITLSIDQSAEENQIEGPLTRLQFRLRVGPGGVKDTFTSDELRQAVWPFRRLLQPNVDFWVELPEGHEGIPNSQWFWDHRRDTINCEELLFEIVNLANYVIQKADCKLFIDQFFDAFILYDMLCRFLNTQSAKPALEEYIELQNTRAVDFFNMTRFYCSDGLLIAHMLRARPNPRLDRPPDTFLGSLFASQYQHTPVRFLCFAIAYASQQQAGLAQVIIRDALQELNVGDWNYPPSLRDTFLTAHALLNNLNQPGGFTDAHERQLWALVPQHRGLIFVDPSGILWQMDDPIAE